MLKIYIIKLKELNFEQALLGSCKSTRISILTENIFNKLIGIISDDCDQFENTQKVRKLFNFK